MEACTFSGVDRGGAGGARAAPEFGGSEKGKSLISAYRSLAITTNTSGFKKQSTALLGVFLSATFLEPLDKCLDSCCFARALETAAPNALISYN